MPPIIETANLWQRRGGVDILRDINLSVERGEVFALIGPTGAGKTTLLRLLDLLDRPASGRIRFDGADVTESPRARHLARRRMGLVLQKPVVFDASVYDNVARGIRWRGASRSDARARAYAALEMVGLADKRDRRARTLSGGEAQRVAIARAIATEPEVLLLDEPTASLDPVSGAAIEDLIRSIMGRYRATIVMSTHDLQQGERLARRVAVLLHGEVHQDDTWHGLLNLPRTRAIADFVGVDNVLDGTIAASAGGVSDIDIAGRDVQALSDLPVGVAVSVCFRAEEVTVALDRQASSARNTFEGTITRVTAAGPVSRLELDCGFRLVALVTRRSAEEMGLEPGRRVFASFKATAAHVIRREAGMTGTGKHDACARMEAR